MNQQLIILGNGFDLTAKLNSTYDAFFEWYFKERITEEKEHDTRMQEFDENENQSSAIGELIQHGTSLTPPTINYWFEFFWQERPQLQGARWSDIESAILDELIKIDKNYDDYYQNRLSGLITDHTREVVRSKLDTLEKPITVGEYINKSKTSFEFIGSDGNGGILITPGSELPSLPALNPNAFYVLTPKENFITALYQDLLDLEEHFYHFLVNELSNTWRYAGNADQLISELIVTEYIPRPLDRQYLPDDDEYYAERNRFIDNKTVATQILSFNYTHETKDSKFANADLYSNVHGEIRTQNIVFGVDGHLIGDNPLFLPFTKTYRIMENTNTGFSLKSNIEYIKVFGHGLADADYSYYQTIFDSVNLYNSETTLIFYYSIYDSNKKNEIVEKHKCAVHQLIRRYGQTLDNKDHGKNMLHKLLIEGRIKLTEFDTSFL